MMPSGSVTDYIKSKRIKVYANGESHCYNFTLNPRQFKGWTAILIYLTEILKPCGHIHKIIELKSRKEIHCFDDIVSDETYIALGKHSKFKLAPGGYEYLSHRDILRRTTITKKYYTGEPDPSLAQFLMETEKKHLTVVYFVVNGKTCQSPQKVVLNKYDLMRSCVTRNYLAKILDVPAGIQFVATIFGDILKDLQELQHGFPYVALPYNDAFVNMDYLNFFSEENGCKPPLTFNIQQIVNKDKSEKPKGYGTSISISRTKAKPVVRENNGGSVTSESTEVENMEKINNEIKEPIFPSNKPEASKSATDNIKEIEEIKKTIEEIQKAIEETQKAIKETQKENKEKLKRRLTVEETHKSIEENQNDNKVKLKSSLIVAESAAKNQKNIKPKLIAEKPQKDIKETLKPRLVVEELPKSIEENQNDIKTKLKPSLEVAATTTVIKENQKNIINQLKPRVIEEPQKDINKTIKPRLIEENENDTKTILKSNLGVAETTTAIKENQKDIKNQIKPRAEETQKDINKTIKPRIMAENENDTKTKLKPSLGVTETTTAIKENHKDQIKPRLIEEAIEENKTGTNEKSIVEETRKAVEEPQVINKENLKPSVILTEMEEKTTEIKEIEENTKEKLNPSLIVEIIPTSLQEIQKNTMEISKSSPIVVEESTTALKEIQNDNIGKSKSSLIVVENNKYEEDKPTEKNSVVQNKEEIEKSKSNIIVAQTNDKLALDESKYEKKEFKYNDSIMETKRETGSIICSQNILIKPCSCIRSKLISSDEEIDKTFDREDKNKRPT